MDVVIRMAAKMGLATRDLDVPTHLALPAFLPSQYRRYLRLRMGRTVGSRVDARSDAGKRYDICLAGKSFRVTHYVTYCVVARIASSILVDSNPLNLEFTVHWVTALY